MSWRSRFWGLIAILLGAWESVAFVTKQLPTISRVNWVLHKRYGWKSRAPILAMLAGLARHLLIPPKE